MKRQETAQAYNFLEFNICAYDSYGYDGSFEFSFHFDISVSFFVFVGFIFFLLFLIVILVRSHIL